MKAKTYAVMIISRKLNELSVGGFKAKSDRDAEKKFKKWWPGGNGYLRYKLYRLVDTAAGR